MMMTQHRIVCQYDFGGGGIVNKTTHDPAMMELARTFISHVKWNGLLLLDFIRDREGRYFLLEANPKV